MNNGVNVTNKYNIINSKSPFSINKRNITIDTMSCSKEYDGIKSFDKSNSVDLYFNTFGECIYEIDRYYAKRGYV